MTISFCRIAAAVRMAEWPTPGGANFPSGCRTQNVAGRFVRPSSAPLAPPAANPARWRRRGPPSRTASRPATAPPAGGTFSPQRPLLRLDNHGYSPAALRLIVLLAARLDSFADAAFALTQTGLPISAQHVRPLAAQVGGELVEQRDRKADRDRNKVPVRVACTPSVVAVQIDGGRIRTRAAAAGRA